MKFHVMMLSAVISAGLALSGCQTDPYTGEQEGSKTGYGAAIGAVAGAGIGALAGHDAASRSRGALIGAAAGGLIGAGVGQYMDRQEARLREQLRGTGVSVTRQGDNIILNMPGNITFRTGSADLNGSFYNVLNSVVLVLKEFDKTLCSVEGHTDSTGKADFNQKLSEDRASAVANYLASQGIAGNRLSSAGYGPNRPIADNKTDAGRQQNRRVELHLEPLRAPG